MVQACLAAFEPSEVPPSRVLGIVGGSKVEKEIVVMATETKNMDRRWLVIVGTAMVQLGVGTFYAWSILIHRFSECFIKLC